MIEESELIKKAWEELKKSIQIAGERIIHYYNTNKELSKGSVVICPVCGQLFTKTRKNHYFCSPECQKKYTRYLK